MEFQKATPRRHKITFQFEGEEDEIEYIIADAAKCNNQLKAAFATDDPLAMVKAEQKFLIESLYKWNITDEKGNPVLISAEAIERLDEDLLLEIIKQIGLDLQKGRLRVLVMNRVKSDFPK